MIASALRHPARWALSSLAAGALVFAALGCGEDDSGGTAGGGGAAVGGTGGSGGAGAGGTGGSGGSGGSGAAGGSGGGVNVDSGPPPFPIGHVFVAGFNDKKVFEYDATLASVTSWTHPSFSVTEGPSGMVFDAKGHLVVAAFDQFCVFSAPGTVLACHPKIKPQRTENVIFDIEGHLFTTTSTGGTDEIHKYDSSYKHLKTFSLPTGQLTGITCDPSGNLYVASQISASKSVVYKVDKASLAVLDSFDVAGNAEGLQFAADGNLLVALSAGVGIARVTPKSPSTVVSTVSNPGLLWPVPLTVDETGRVYTGDFEDGNGSAASDLFVFDATGKVVASRQPSELHGPFGMVVAGTKLPCGAYQPR